MTENIKQVGENLAEMGRAEDDVLGHLAKGEIVIPLDILEAYPELTQQLSQMFQEQGSDLEMYIVGNAKNHINPKTGLPEFKFFKKLFKAVKAIAPIAVNFIPGVGPIAAAAIGAGLGATGGGGLMGAITGGLSGYAGNSLVKGLGNGGVLSKIGNFVTKNPLSALGLAGKVAGSFSSGNSVTPNLMNPGTGGSNQTMSSLNAYNWNNVPRDGRNMYGQNATDMYGKAITQENQNNVTGGTQVSQPYNTYLGTF